MKRVGNDHEELHNAKISPDGYYTGFFHKDYEGNYVQKHRRHHYRDNSMVQVSDHDNDSDDIPYSYEADGAKAMPNEKSDFDLVQTDAKIRESDPNSKEWGAYFNHKSNQVLTDIQQKNEEMERVYAQEEDEGSYEYVQIHSQFNHDDDTQDIADDQDPLQLAKRGGRNHPAVPTDTIQSLAEKAEEKKENDATEVQQYIQEQKEEDK